VVAVELAILLSFLLVVGLGVADMWLLFHRASIVQECATNGAAAGVAMGSSAIQGAVDETASPIGAAWIDRLIPAPTATQSSGTDGNGFTYIDVTVTYTPDGSVFAFLSTGTTPIARTVRMMKPPGD
jgi:Flp pilus assembly protein TadG